MPLFGSAAGTIKVCDAIPSVTFRMASNQRTEHVAGQERGAEWRPATESPAPSAETIQAKCRSLKLTLCFHSSTLPTRLTLPQVPL